MCYKNLDLFSQIKNKECILAKPGLMIEKWWLELENKFKNIKLDQYIIMPNHFHGIIIMTDSFVGDDLCVVPETETHKHSLPNIIRWFKTMTTNDYIKGVKANIFAPFEKHLWQRSYYDRIIRNEKEFHKIQAYIYYNPLKWEWEKNNPENMNVD